MKEEMQTTSKQELPSIPMDEGLGIFTPGHFEQAQRVAQALCSSDLVPTDYRGPGKVANCLIALDMATRLKANPLAIMQNLYVVHGRPSWSSTFIAGAVNTCGRFHPVQYVLLGEGDDYGCHCTAKVKGTDQQLDGPRVTISMAKKEGWFGRKGSKWQTMPELMLRYRAVTLFGRLYAPEILLGMNTEDEVVDMNNPVEKQISDEIPMGQIGAQKSADREEGVTNDAPKPKRKRRTKAEMEQSRMGEQQSEAPEPEQPAAPETESGNEPENVEVLPTAQSVSPEQEELEKVLTDKGFAMSDFNYFMNVQQDYDVVKNGFPTQFTRAILKDPSALLAELETLRSGQ